MRHLILCLLLALVSASTMFAKDSEKTYDFMENGIGYKILSNGTLSVTFIWPKSKEGFHHNPWKHVLLYKGDVVIPSAVTHEGKEYKVTVLGNNAFFCCEELTSLVLPEGLRRIEFQSIVLTKIRSLNIPSTVTELVPGAITQCKFLSDLTVAPGNPKYVSKGNCIYTKNMKQLLMVSPMLKTYQFPPSVTSVEDFVFNYSTITRLVIPPTLEYIGGKAFDWSFIGNIVCDKILKHLPGSRKFLMNDPIPQWAVGKGVYQPYKRDDLERPCFYDNPITKKVSKKKVTKKKRKSQS